MYKVAFVSASQDLGVREEEVAAAVVGMEMRVHHGVALEFATCGTPFSAIDTEAAFSERLRSRRRAS
jgi:hypothetical protein